MVVLSRRRGCCKKTTPVEMCAAINSQEVQVGREAVQHISEQSKVITDVVVQREVIMYSHPGPIIHN